MPTSVKLYQDGILKANLFDEFTTSESKIHSDGKVTSTLFDENLTSELSGNTMMRIKDNNNILVSNYFDEYNPVQNNLFEAQGDYFVIHYNYINGLDLDTRTILYDPSNLTYSYPTIGWCRNNSVVVNSYTVLEWGGDNRNIGRESILFDSNRYQAAFPGINTIYLKFSAYWYSSVGTDPVTISISSYKGGQMIPSNYDWINPTALESHEDFISYSKIVTRPREAGCANDGELITYMALNFVDGTITYSQTL